MAKVRVKLAARCLVDGQVRDAGEIVEVDEIHAKDFGTPMSAKEAASTGKPEDDKA
jgi:hypothetical protein